MLSDEDFINAYREIAKASFDTTHPLQKTLELVRINYRQFLLDPNKLLPGRRRNLADQFILLEQRNFFSKENLEKAQLIQHEINVFEASNSKKNNIDLENILSTIDADYQQTLTTVKNFPDKMATGFFTQSELFSSPSREFNKEGVKHYQNQEWKEAVYFFEKAVGAEQKIPFFNEKTLLVFKRNRANAYGSLGHQFFTNATYADAILTYRKSINDWSDIFSKTGLMRDQKNLVYRQKNLCESMNRYAKKCYAENKGANLEGTISQFRAVLDECKKIPMQFVEEKDLKKYVDYQRDLMKVLHAMGQITLQHRNYDEAKKYFKEARSILNEILDSEFDTINDLNFIYVIENDIEKIKRLTTGCEIRKSSCFSFSEGRKINAQDDFNEDLSQLKNFSHSQ